MSSGALFLYRDVLVVGCARPSSAYPRLMSAVGPIAGKAGPGRDVRFVPTGDIAHSTANERDRQLRRPLICIYLFSGLTM